jgi:hypothetical protein
MKPFQYQPIVFFFVCIKEAKLRAATAQKVKAEKLVADRRKAIDKADKVREDSLPSLCILYIWGLYKGGCAWVGGVRVLI